MAEIPDKPFYKIGEVCQYTDTQPYVLRFWESEFPRLAPQKSRSGQRMYTRRDIDLVFRIKQLLYEEEFTIAGARKKLEQEEGGEAVEPSTAGSEQPAAAAPPAKPLPTPPAASPREPEMTPLFEEGAPADEPSPAAEPAPPVRAEADLRPAAPSTAERARAVIAEAEMGALRKRIADLESRHAQLAASLEEAERARRRDRERRERIAARLEALLRSLEATAAAEPAEQGDLDGRPGIS